MQIILVEGTNCDSSLAVVIPAKLVSAKAESGNPEHFVQRFGKLWIPAFAGMTEGFRRNDGGVS